jgi:Flp pilus assembly protein TadD
MSRTVGFVALCWLTAGCLLGAEQTWEISAEFQSLVPGNPERVVMKLADGATVELPLQIFSDRGQELVREAAGRPAGQAGGVDLLLAEVAAAAAGCRTASDAVLVYRIGLAGDGIPEQSRAAAAAALAEWETRAARGDVRLGKEWVAPAKAEAAARTAAGHIDEVTTMARLGNLKLVRETLEKASRADPANGRADFLLGLAAIVGVGQRPDPVKAGKSFAEVIAREPGNGMAHNNLAICHAYNGKLNDAIAHFEAAAERLDDPQVVAANVAALIGGTGARVKLSNKQIEALTALYRKLAPDQAGQPPAPQAGPTFLSPFGLPVAQQSKFADLCVQPAGVAVERVEAGVVVAANVVLVASSLPYRGGMLGVRSVDGQAGELPAVEIASSPSLGLVLLRCDGLSAPPLSLAAALPEKATPLIARLPPGQRAMTPAEAGSLVAADVMPDGVFVHTAAGLGHPAATPLADRSGRVVGLSIAAPSVPLAGTPRGAGRSIERIWPFLRDHLPDLEPVVAAEPRPSWDAVRAELAKGTVTVVARPPAASGP